MIVYSKKQIIQNYYKYEDSKIDVLKEKIGRVIPEIHHVELYGSNKSFTIDKKVSYICLKDANGSYYQDNMLVYVILHELAHVLCDEVRPPNEEHTPKWEAIFKELLARAEAGGVYNSKIPILSDYCGY